MIHRMGLEIKHPESVWYWAAKNDIPVFCPAITDGSVGDMIYFHSYKREGFVLDIARDIRGINDVAVWAKKTGMIILGGGLVKHHVCNANLMRNGADFAVFINTGAWRRRPRRMSTRFLPVSFAVASCCSIAVVQAKSLTVPIRELGRMRRFPGARSSSRRGPSKSTRRPPSFGP